MKLSLQRLARAESPLRSGFLKNVAIVMSGTAVAQAVGFVLSPVVSRLYSPLDFGVYGSFDAVLAVLAAVATLDYAQAILLPRAQVEALNLVALSCVSTAVVCALCLATWTIAPSLAGRLLQDRSPWLSLLLVIAVMVSGVNTTLQGWCVRVKSFKRTSSSQVIRSMSANGTQIALGYLRGGAYCLAGAMVLGDLLASVSLLPALLRDLKRYRPKIRLRTLRAVAAEYKDFPLYSATQNTVNALSQGLPVLLLTHFYGVAAAGAYAFAVRILSVPMRFILAPLRQVLFQRASEAENAGDALLPLYRKVTTGLFAMAVVPCVAMMFFSPRVFSWVFGDRWVSAGVFAQSLLVWLMVAFCNLPAVLFAKVIRIQRSVFFYDMSLLCVRAGALVLGGMYLRAEEGVALFSLAGAAMNAFLILWVGRAVMVRDKRVGAVTGAVTQSQNDDH